jgi:hypothetical protein
LSQSQVRSSSSSRIKVTVAVSLTTVAVAVSVVTVAVSTLFVTVDVSVVGICIGVGATGAGSPGAQGAAGAPGAHGPSGVGGPGPSGAQGAPGVGTVNSGALDFVAYYTGPTSLSAASGTNNVKIGGVLYANTTAAVLRSVTPSYTDGGRVFISGTTPTAVAAGDIWIDTAGTSGYTQSLTSSGYTKLPNGLLIQWGNISDSATSERSSSFSFPIAFYDTPYSVTVTPRISSASNFNDLYTQVISTTSSGATVYYQSSGGDRQIAGYYFIAMGPGQAV